MGLSSIQPVLLLWFCWNTGSSSAGPPEEYIARLDVEIDSARQGWFEIKQNHVKTSLMIF